MVNGPASGRTGEELLAWGGRAGSIGCVQLMLSSPVVGIGVLLGVLALAVFASMLVENWGRWSEPIAVPEPAGRSWSDRDALAALFAAYVAGRRPAAGRVGGWITAAGCPESLDSMRFTAGMSLRNKPARVADLVAATDGGRCWVGLNDSVDIAAGLRRSPVRDPLLASIMLWWAHVESGGELDAVATERVADVAIELGRAATVSGTPTGRLLEQFAGALRSDEGFSERRRQVPQPQRPLRAVDAISVLQRHFGVSRSTVRRAAGVSRRQLARWDDTPYTAPAAGELPGLVAVWELAAELDSLDVPVRDWINDGERLRLLRSRNFGPLVAEAAAWTQRCPSDDLEEIFEGAAPVAA